MARKRDPEFVFSDGLECVLCGQKDRPVVTTVKNFDPNEKTKEDSVKGICEVCSVRTYWEWKSEIGDTNPGADLSRSKKISKVKVLVPRLRQVNGDTLEPSFVDAYEFAMVASGKHLDLPSEDFEVDEASTALRALDKANLISWRWCIEPLYRGYTPRGGLVSIVLATAYAKKAADSKIDFRPWPLEDHVDPGMAGLYLTLLEVWSLRLYKWAKLLKPTNAISVLVKESTKEYIRLKLAGAKNVGNVDTSMIEYYRKIMTADEKYVCELCIGGEKIDDEINDQVLKDEVKVKKENKPPKTDTSEPGIDGNKTELLEAFDEYDDEDEIGDKDDSPEGFVRNGRELSREDD